MKKRVFLAINLPDEIRSKVANFSLKLKNKLPERGVKFVENENLHITLHFLGDQTEQKIEELQELSRKIAKKYSGFEIVIDELSAFPNKKFPRIFVLSSEEKNKEVGELRSDLGEALENITIEIDKRKWEAHMSLARIKFGKINFASLKKEEVGELRWVVYGFDLVESKLTEKGPVYKVIETFNFK